MFSTRKEAKTKSLKASILSFQVAEIDTFTWRTIASCEWEWCRRMGCIRKSEEREADEDNIAIKRAVEIEVGYDT